MRSTTNLSLQKSKKKKLIRRKKDIQPKNVLNATNLDVNNAPKKELIDSSKTELAKHNARGRGGKLSVHGLNAMYDWAWLMLGFEGSNPNFIQTKERKYVKQEETSIEEDDSQTGQESSSPENQVKRVKLKKKLIRKKDKS